MRKLFSVILVLLLAASLTAQSKLSGTAKVSGTVKVSAQAGGGETDFVTDTFTEAGSSTIDLASHTGELGATWTHHPHANYTANTVLDRDTDRIFDSNTSAYYASGTPPGADYCSEAVVFVVSVISANAAITVRMDATADTMYIFRLNSGTSWDVRRIVTGTATTLGTTSTTNLPGVGESRTMKLCVSGGATPTLTGYVDGSALSGPGGLDGSPITATGNAGVRFSGAMTTTTGYHFNSFRAFTP